MKELWEGKLVQLQKCIEDLWSSMGDSKTVILDLLELTTYMKEYHTSHLTFCASTTIENGEIVLKNQRPTMFNKAYVHDLLTVSL